MGIQINALSALGQLGRQNSQASHEICACGILDEMVQSLSHENSHIRCAANISLQVTAINAPRTLQGCNSLFTPDWIPHAKHYPISPMGSSPLCSGTHLRLPSS